MNIDYDKLKEELKTSFESTEYKLQQIRAGRANPTSLDPVMVEYYGVSTPLKQLATISVPEARQLMIKPFDKSAIEAIRKGILVANLGYNPTDDGNNIFITIPELTEETRKNYVKQTKSLVEEGRISVRNIRREFLDDLEKMDGVSEDDSKRAEKEVQAIIEEYNKKLDQMSKAKEEELMKI